MNEILSNDGTPILSKIISDNKLLMQNKADIIRRHDKANQTYGRLTWFWYIRVDT